MPDYLSDYLKIINSRAFKRLQDKTQVFGFRSEAHNRLTHSVEVASIASLIADKLGLDSKLCQAIAIGHDVGHTPLGHVIEDLLSNRNGYFRHEVNSGVVLQLVEGLNLPDEVINGVLYHSRGGGELVTESGVPLEFDVVMFADKIGYTISDFDDALRVGLLNPDISFYESIIANANELGGSSIERFNHCIGLLVEESLQEGRVAFTNPVFNELRSQMYRVYGLMSDSDCLVRRMAEPVLDLLVESSADDFMRTAGISVVNAYDPDPYLMFSLLTDSELKLIFDESLKRNLSLGTVINRTALKDYLPSLLRINPESIRAFYNR